MAVASLFFVLSVPKMDSNNVGPGVSDPANPRDPGDSSNPSGNPSDDCQITSCHGLDVACGSDGPQMCTMEYRLGDFCREFAVCQKVSGECQLAVNEKFESCKSCVESCTQTDPLDAFACEDVCRKVMNE